MEWNLAETLCGLIMSNLKIEIKLLRENTVSGAQREIENVCGELGVHMSLALIPNQCQAKLIIILLPVLI
jgi:hypothetical protein